MAAVLLVSACDTIELPDDKGSITHKQHKVNIRTRTAVGTQPLYPIAVYAFDDTGRCRARQTIESVATPLALSLPSGNYRIVALSGHTAYRLEEPTDVNAAALSMSTENNQAEQPLMRGEAALTVGTSKTSVTLTLAYAVAGMEITLSNIPSAVEAVSVKLNDLPRQLTWNNAYSSPSATLLPCRKNSDGTWSTGTKYVFPNDRSSTVLSISLTEASQTRQYGFTLNSGLKAATPYRLKGSYSTTGDMLIDGEILSIGWNAPFESTFSFGAGQPLPLEPPSSPDDTPTSPNERPRAGSVWKGRHVVAFVENETAEAADLILLSTQGWSNLPSALSPLSPDEAQGLAQTYTEGTLTGWSIPSQETARRLSELYSGEQLAQLNQTLSSLGGEPVYTTYNQKNARYLCEAATMSYAFRLGGGILAAGKTVKNYHLRLVKRVHIKFS